MATRLFLNDALNDLSGTYPTTKQSVVLTPTYSVPNQTGVVRKMRSLTGTSMVARSFTASPTVAAQVCFQGAWASSKLDVNQNIVPQPCTINIANRETSLSMNIGSDLRVCAYVWRPTSGGSLVGMIVDGLVMTGDAEPGAISSIRVNNASVTSTVTIAALAGDVVMVEIYQLHTQAAGTALQGTLYYNGTTVNQTTNAVVTSQASFFELSTSTLTFSVDIPATASASFGNTLAAVTLSGTGNSPRNGSFGATLATVGLSATAKLLSSASAAFTLGTLTLAGTGTVADPVTLSASFGNTLADVTLSGTGTSPRNGSLGATLAALTLAGTATVPLTGSLAATLQRATLSGTGDLPIQGNADNTLGDATLMAASAQVSNGAYTNTLDAATLSAAGSVVPLTPPVQIQESSGGSGAAYRPRRKFRIPEDRDEVSVLDRIFGVEETPTVLEFPARPKHLPYQALATAVLAASFTQPPPQKPMPKIRVAAPEYSDEDLISILLLAI